ncbi:MAG: hypothetical protein ABH950_03960 [Candidatus Altiarchaeota archaeon]
MIKKEEVALALTVVVVILFGFYFYSQIQAEKVFQELLDANCEALLKGDVEELLSYTTLVPGSSEYQKTLKEKTDLLKTVTVESCSQNIKSITVSESIAHAKVDLNMVLVGADGKHPTTVPDKDTTFVLTAEGWKIQPHEGF